MRVGHNDPRVRPPARDWDDEHALMLQSDALESESSSSAGGESPQEQPAEPSAALVAVDAAAKKYPSTYARQKHEIGLLRQHAAALEAKLRGMAKAADSALASVRTKRSACRSAAAQSSQSSWAELADVQRRRLQLAQRENRSLRRSAQDHKRMARNLQQILLRRVASKNVIVRDTLSLSPALLCPVSPDADFAVFANVCREILAISPTAASALDVIERKVPASPGVRQWHIHSDADGGFFLEVAYCIELPFAKADVDHAFLVLRRQATVNTSRYEPHVYGAPPGVRLTKSVVSYSSPVEMGFYRVYHANRTFVDAARSVSYQVAYVDSAEEDRPLPGGTLREHQRNVVTERTYVDAHTGRQAASTVIQTVSVISALHQHSWTREVAEHAVIPVWNQAIALGQQNLENTLLDQQRLRTRPLLLRSFEDEVEAILTTLESDGGDDDDAMSSASASDSSSSASWEVDSSTGVSSLAMLEMPAKPKFRSSHARQKHEKNALLKQIVALEEAIKQRSSSADVASVGGDASLLHVVAKWKQTALSQRKQLQRARSENRLLKRSAQDQKRMAKGLERILLKRVAHNLMMGERLSDVPRSFEIDDAVSPDDDNAVFAKSIADLDKMTRGASTALAILESETPSSGSFSKWEVRLDRVEREYLRLVTAFEVPFKKTDVDAVLHHLRTHPTPNTRSYDPQSFGGSPDMVMVTALESYASPVETGVYRARQATKVFVLDDERTLLLSVSYLETADSSRRAAGMVLKSQQWILLSQRTHVNDHTGDAQHSTTIQFYSTISSATAHPGRWRREVAEDIVAPAWERECAVSQSEVESLLLQQARNKTQ